MWVFCHEDKGRALSLSSSAYDIAIKEVVFFSFLFFFFFWTLFFNI